MFHQLKLFLLGTLALLLFSCSEPEDNNPHVAAPAAIEKSFAFAVDEDLGVTGERFSLSRNLL